MSSKREDNSPLHGHEYLGPNDPAQRLVLKGAFSARARGTHAHFEELSEPIYSRSGSPFTSYSQASLATSGQDSTGTRATSVSSRSRAAREQESRRCSSHEDDSSSREAPSRTGSPKPPLEELRTYVDRSLGSWSWSGSPEGANDREIADEVYESDEDYSDLEVDDDFEDPEWSGGQDEIEAAVLSSIPDLQFAARLIVKLHEDHMTSEGSKIDGWREGIRCHAGNNNSPENKAQAVTNPGSSNHNTSNSRKRRSGSDNSVERGNSDDEEGDERDGEEPQPLQVIGVSRSNEAMTMFACPFNKYDSARYRICAETRNHYRVCASPFKTIQRIKEHIFRKHYPVQCDRCFKKFAGPDRASCLRDREAHRLDPIPCAAGDRSLREGISDVQCEKLKGNNGKKAAKSSTVQKWWDIWDILFPEAARPSHPWYEQSNTNTAVVRPLHGDQQRFIQVFNLTFDNLLANGKIQFTAGREEEMQDNLMEAVQYAWNLYYRLWGHAASSSSSGQTYTQPTEIQTPRSNDTCFVGRQPVSKKRKGNALPASRSALIPRPGIAYAMPDQSTLAGLTPMNQAMFTAPPTHTFSDPRQVPRYTPSMPPHMSTNVPSGNPFYNLDIDMNFAGEWPNETLFANEPEDLNYVNIGGDDSNDLPTQ